MKNKKSLLFGPSPFWVIYKDTWHLLQGKESLFLKPFLFLPISVSLSSKPKGFSLTVTVIDLIAMDLLRSNLSHVRIPEPTNRIFKQECCFTFDTPVINYNDNSLPTHNFISFHILFNSVHSFSFSFSALRWWPFHRHVHFSCLWKTLCCLEL